ncbi:MAG: 5-dehydro-4-deoxyglucarate dehydratase KdgD, partial [Halomonas sp. HL-93]
FIDLRDQKAGYAVSLVKAGAEIIGRPAGDVRAPLTMPTMAERQTLARIIESQKSN